jgi:ubiquinone biosynthesis protein
MTQEFIKGVKITDIARLDAAGVDRPTLVAEFLRAMIQQILIDRFFHADPHPGNVLVNLETGTIIFIDMGLMGNLTSEHRMGLIDLLWAINDRDGYDLAKTIMRISTRIKPNVDEGRFIADLERLMKRYQLLAEETANLSGVLGEAMRRAGLRLHSDLTLALKALIQAEEIVHTLDPSLDLAVVAFAEVKDLVRKEIDVDKVKKLVRQQVVRTGKELVRHIPSLSDAAVKWVEQYERGQLSLHIDTSELGQEVDKLDSTLSRNISRALVGLLLAGVLIASAIVTTIPDEIAGVRLSSIAFFMFVGSALIATAIVLRFVWTAWREPSIDIDL